MKHAHIGLVALAAVLVAGCGGGSDNGGGGSFAEDVTGLGGAAARSALAGEVGKTYEVPAGKSLTVDVPDGQVTITGCRDGCMVRVSSDNGKVVVMSTAKGVSGRFVAKAAPPTTTPQPPPPGVPEDEVQRRVEEGTERGRQQGEETGAAKAEVEDRAEGLLTKLSGITASSRRIKRDGRTHAGGEPDSQAHRGLLQRPDCAEHPRLYRRRLYPHHGPILKTRSTSTPTSGVPTPDRSGRCMAKTI